MVYLIHCLVCSNSNCAPSEHKPKSRRGKPGLTIARYSAAITSGLREVTGRDRGGIAGRWTKPVAAPRVCAAASEARSLSRTQLGELYPASTGAASVASSSREGT